MNAIEKNEFSFGWHKEKSFRNWNNVINVNKIERINERRKQKMGENESKRELNRRYGNKNEQTKPKWLEKQREESAAKQIGAHAKWWKAPPNQTLGEMWIIYRIASSEKYNVQSDEKRKWNGRETKKKWSKNAVEENGKSGNTIYLTRIPENIE